MIDQNLQLRLDLSFNGASDLGNGPFVGNFTSHSQLSSITEGFIGVEPSPSDILSGRKQNLQANKKP
jgi:hypothetical protein